MSVLSKKIWVLKTKGSRSAFGGNDGYEDDPEAFYEYDNYVKNYEKLKIGDTVIVADRHFVLGLSTVSVIIIDERIKKLRYRCPECGIYEFYERAKIRPKYKCRNKHVFDKPVKTTVEVTKFIAHYRESFISPIKAISTSSLVKDFINYNRYYSIQEINPRFLKTLSPSVKKVIRGDKSRASDPDYLVRNFNDPPYIPKRIDRRNFISSQKADRKGQVGFKKKLIKAYEHRCMLSECDVAETLQASHICPFRGQEDHHPANGLLLRADLHLLFDADLLGIHPQTLKVHLHPSIARSYKQFVGKKLSLGKNARPCPEALEYRYAAFIEKLNSQLR